MLKKFIAANTIPHNEKVALAVSGGADSMCMTYLFHEMQKHKVTVMIVNHNLRSESLSEAEMIQKYIQTKFNFETIILHWNANVCSNIQAEARAARYQLLTEKCQDLHIRYLCTAHHSNDQAETLLLNILRGTGIDGLVGIRDGMEMNNIQIFRPLLKLSRDEIIQCLKENDVFWIEDSSNINEKYERVKIRKLLKTIENSNLINAKHLVSRLNLLATNSLRTHNFILQYVERKIEEICIFWALRVITINFTGFIQEDEEIQLRILRNLIRYVNEKKQLIRGDSLLRLHNKILQSYKLKKDFDMTVGECIIYSKSNVLVMCKERKRTRMSIQKNEVSKIHSVLTNITAYDDYAITNEKVYEGIRDMALNIPKLYNVLKYLQYEVNATGEIMYKLLGIKKHYKV